MLTVSNISKQFRGADAPILKNISFTVNAGERVGLIGPNGSGKSTLLKIIIGEISADSGGIVLVPTDLRIGYLGQGIDPDSSALVRDVLYPNISALRQAEADVERLAAHLADSRNGDLERLSTDYNDALERLERYSTEVDSGQGERMLAELDLAGIPLDTPVGMLSGGQKTRLGLAALLLQQPQLLILDEP